MIKQLQIIWNHFDTELLTRLRLFCMFTSCQVTITCGFMGAACGHIRAANVTFDICTDLTLSKSCWMACVTAITADGEHVTAYFL